MLLFSSIVEYRLFVYTCVFLNRIASFEKLKIVTTSIKTQFLMKMVDGQKSKRTMHKITVKMLYSLQCLPFYLSLFA